MENLSKAWTETLSLIASRAAPPWLRRVQPLGLHDSTVVLGVPDPFARQILQERYSQKIEQVLSVTLGREVKLQLVLSSPSEREEPTPSAHQPLNPRYTFDSFVVGPSNRLAHAACLAVAEAPARAYNPLFIYGGVGLGKTHLMHAIAHHILKHNSRARVVYASSETFTNELINALRDKRITEFRARYRHVDVLLVDDIQFIGGKETTQEEFFHTFNTLHEARKQIVLSSDRPPHEIATLEERLRSRFQWGLLSDIQPPDLETRIAILKKKALQEKIDLPDEVALFIAQAITNNIRELEGALIRLVAYTSLHHLPLDESTARAALGHLLPQTRLSLTPRQIQEAVAEHYRIDPAELLARKRSHSVALARQVAMYLTRELTGLSFPRIGEEFGGRDHTTVLHAWEKISQEVGQNPGLALAIESIKRRMGCKSEPPVQAARSKRG